jgi:hypothetical protein
MIRVQESWRSDGKCVWGWECEPKANYLVLALTSVIVQHVIVIQAELQAGVRCVCPLEGIHNDTVGAASEQIACKAVTGYKG